jgi:hypothetical protein
VSTGASAAKNAAIRSALGLPLGTAPMDLIHDVKDRSARSRGPPRARTSPAAEYAEGVGHSSNFAADVNTDRDP